MLFLLGGSGGSGPYQNGLGGWSYYNPKAVVKILENWKQNYYRSGAAALSDSRSSTTPIWKSRGPGRVVIVPPLRKESCQRNCSLLGAVCVAVGEGEHAYGCLCQNGVLLDLFDGRHNRSCSEGNSNICILNIPSSYMNVTFMHLCFEA